MYRRLLILIGLFCATSRAQDQWVWGGIPFSAVPKEAGTLYVHQGTFRGELVHQGLSPFPLVGHDIYLVFRLDRIENAPRLVEAAKDAAARWEDRGTHVVGLQIDFDSASARLGAYADFLAVVRAKLPPKYRLSVTGLADWSVSAKPESLPRIAGAIDEIVFQLYRGRSPIAELPRYAARLGRVRFPFKIGLLESMATPEVIRRNPFFRGTIIFSIRRKESETRS